MFVHIILLYIFVYFVNQMVLLLCIHNELNIPTKFLIDMIL